MATVSPAVAPALHTVWAQLTESLLTVFDTHTVCATLAAQIAPFTGAKTVVCISDDDRQNYDVWIAAPDKTTEQVRWRSEASGLDPIVRSAGPQYLQKLSRSAAELLRSELWLLPHHAVTTVPLPNPPSDQNPIPRGAIILIDPPDGCPLTPEALGQLAMIATTFLDRAYLQRRVDRQNIEFSVISDISHSLSATLNLAHIFEQLRGPIRQTLNVETLSVGLIDKPTGDIVFVNTLMGPELQSLPSVRVKQGQGIAGWVAEHGEPVVLNDTYSDKRFFSGVDRKSGFRTRSMMCIPLQVEERRIGVLQAINRLSGEFSDHDLGLLQALGGPLAAAIENANLHADVVTSKNRIETMLAGMSEGFVTLTPEGIILRANDAFASLLFSEPVDLGGRDIRDVVELRIGDLSNLINGILRAQGSESPQLAADMRHTSGRYVPVLISASTMRDDDGAVAEILLIFSDLTMIREVERMREDLFQSIVHELRTPLATILMYARLIREGKATQPEKAERFLGVIERESDRLQKMVREMLEVARLESRETQRGPQAVRLNPIFDEILPAMADRAVQKGLQFRQRIAEDLPPVMGNSETYHTVVKNLIENAVKYTPSGEVRISAREADGFVLIEVTDDGIGIPKEALPHLFKRFYRTQTAVERGIAGTGLGLYLVKESLQTYNGQIEVTSEPDQGSTFRVHLPIAEET
jgi:two-component system phosphate regulon sensor histidine kinase PhoR